MKITVTNLRKTEASRVAKVYTNNGWTAPVANITLGKGVAPAMVTWVKWDEW